MEIVKKIEWNAHPKEVNFTLDTEGNFSELNYAWTLLTGYAINETLHKPLTFFVESMEEIQHLKKFILSNDLKELNVELTVKTSTFTKIVEACFYKIYDSNVSTSIFGTLIDITKWKESGSMLMQQLTCEYENRKELNNLLNLFSHDLSSAQAAVFSSVELLEMINSSTKEAMEKTNNHYSNIKAQTQNINMLLDDFLLKWRRIYLKEDEKITINKI